MKQKVLVVLPAYNEELTIARMIEEIHHHLPEAFICVVNNNSKDHTSQITEETFEKLNIKGSKGILLQEYKQGKSNAIRKAFYTMVADVYIMVDADCTYDISVIKELLQPVLDEKADMVIGDRHSGGYYKNENKRNFHGVGNRLVKNIINLLYRTNLKDILSGYRIFSSSYINNFPVTTSGFELEIEMTLFALENKYTIVEVPIIYKDRPANSFSKLNTISDGIKVLIALFDIFKSQRPFLFFGSISLFCALLCIAIGLPVVFDFLETGLVLKFPSAFLAMGLGILSVSFFTVGLILGTIVNIERKNTEFRKKSFVEKRVL